MRSGFAHAAGCTLHYVTAGEGEPLVCLHGMSNNAQSWDAQLCGLGDRFTVIAWDAPGYGNSADPSPELERFEQFADALLLLLNQLKLPAVHLLGHSMGAAIAVAFGARHPERVRKLILADPTRGAAGLDEAENERRLQARLDNVARFTPAEMAERRVDALLAPHPNANVRANALRIMAQVRPPGYRSVARSLYHADQTALYKQLQVPVLLLCGELDEVTPVRESRAIQACIPGSELRTIPGTGHLCYQEDPIAFNQLVRNFLS